MMDIDDALFASAHVTGADVTDADVSGADVTGTDGEAGGHAVGRVGSVEMFDVDDDGYSETRVSYTDAGMTVARDTDADCVMDTFTSISRGGHYESWEIFRAADGSARWEQTSSGDVFE